MNDHKWIACIYIAVEGAFVRVSIGYNRNKNEAEYRMAEVKCIEEKGNMYQLKILPQKVGLGKTIAMEAYYKRGRDAVTDSIHFTLSDIKCYDIDDCL